MGLQLFDETTKVGHSKIEMSPDEVIEFLGEVERTSGHSDRAYPYKEKYLEGLLK